MSAYLVLFFFCKIFSPFTPITVDCVELFTTEIYANWVRKEELERWV